MREQTVTIDFDTLRSMSDLLFAAAMAEIRPRIVNTSLDGWRIQVPASTWIRAGWASWEAAHPALRSRRSIRRRRRVVALADRQALAS